MLGRSRTLMKQLYTFLVHGGGQRFSSVTAMRTSYVLGMMCPTPVTRSGRFNLTAYMHNPKALDCVLNFVSENPLYTCYSENVIIQSVSLGLTDTVRVLYSHSHKLYPCDAERWINCDRPELSGILLSGILDVNKWIYVDGGTAGVSKTVVKYVVKNAMSECVSIIINESRCPQKDHKAVVTYAVGYSRLDYIRDVLDRGKVTVNDNRQSFYTAIQKGCLEIVREFLQRGIQYSRKDAYSHFNKSSKSKVDLQSRIAMYNLIH